MFKYWTALYLSTLITKFTQDQIEHGVLDNAFNYPACPFFAYCMYIIFFISEFSMSKFHTLNQMSMSIKQSFRLAG